MIIDKLDCEMIIYWPSPAKLNLFLYITKKRHDGYHALQTLFQFLNYGDSIIIEPRIDKKLNLVTPISGILDRDNLVLRAASLLMQTAIQMHRLPKNSGIDIIIKKKLPIGGGLGGGSSNAATTLVALNYLWKCGLTEQELIELGLKLGADVPIFIYGRSAFAEGIGEIFSPTQPEEKWYLVAHPGINISTEKIFKDLKLSQNTLKKRPIETLLKYKFSNTFEVIVRKRFKKVDETLSWLLEYAPARLTGAGSCAFAEFDTESSARQVLNKAPEWLYCFVAKGTNLSPLKKVILSESQKHSKK